MMWPSRLESSDTKGGRAAVTESEILELRLFDSLTLQRRATSKSVNGLRADSVLLEQQRLRNKSKGSTNGSNRTTAARVRPTILALQVDGGPDNSRPGADGSSSAAAPCFACLSRRRAVDDGFYTADPDPNPFLCDEIEQEDPVLLSALRSLRSALASLSGWSIRLLPSRSQTIIVDGKPAKLREHLRTRRPKRPILRFRPTSDPGGSSLGTAASLGTPSQKRLRFAADELQSDLGGQEDGASESDAAANPTAAASGKIAWSSSMESTSPSGGNVSTVEDDVATPVEGPPVMGAHATNRGADRSSLPGEGSAAPGLTAGGMAASMATAVPVGFIATSSLTPSVGAMDHAGGSSSGAMDGCGGSPVRGADGCGGVGQVEDGTAPPKTTARIVNTLSGVSTGSAAATPYSDSRYSMQPASVSVGSYARQRNSALAIEPSGPGAGDDCRANSSGDAPTVNGPGGFAGGLIASLSSRRSLKLLPSRGQIVPVGDVDTQSEQYDTKRSSTEVVFDAQQNARLQAPLDPPALSSSTPSPPSGLSSAGWGVIVGQPEGAVNPTEQQIAPAPSARAAPNLTLPTPMPSAAYTLPGVPPPTPTFPAGSQGARPPNLLTRLWLLAGPSGSRDSGGGSTTASDCGRDASRSAPVPSAASYQHVSDEFPRKAAPGRVLHNALFEPDNKVAVSAPGMPPTAPLSPQPQRNVTSYTSPGMIQLPVIEGGNSRGTGGGGPVVTTASSMAIQLPTPELMYAQWARPEHQHLRSLGSQKNIADRGKSQDTQRVRGRTPDDADPAALQWWTTVRPLDEDDEEAEEGSSNGRRRHSGPGNGDGAGARVHMMHTLEGARRTCSVTDGATAGGTRWRKSRRRPSDEDGVEDEDEAFMRNLGVGQAAAKDGINEGGANAGTGRRSIRNLTTSGAAPRVSAARDLPLRDNRRNGLTYADLSYSVQQAILTVQSASSQKHRKTGGSLGGCGSDTSSSPKASASAVAALQRSQQIRAAPFAAALGLLQPSFSSGNSSVSTASQLHPRRSTRTLTLPAELPATRSVHDELASHSSGVPAACTDAAPNMDTPLIVERPCMYDSTVEQEPKKGIKAAELGKAESAEKMQAGENKGDAEGPDQAAAGASPLGEHVDRWAAELPFIITDTIPSETAAALLDSSVHPVSVMAAAGHPAAGRACAAASDPVDGTPVLPSGSTLPAGARERSFAGMSILLSQTLAARMEMTSSGPHTIYRSADRSAAANNIRAAPFAAALGLLQQRPRPTGFTTTPQLRTALASGRSFTGMLRSTEPSQTEATTEPVAGIGAVTGRGDALQRVATDSYAAGMHFPRTVGGGGVGRPHLPSFKLPGVIDSMDDVSVDRGAVAEGRTPIAAATSAAAGKPTGELATPVSLRVQMRKPVRRSITESVLMGRDLSASCMLSQELDELGIPGQMGS